VNELISLVVSTYNRPDALGACLRSLVGQSDRNFEIVVADDGSGPATLDVIKAWAAEAGVPVCHAWQQDRGFRLAEIRNRAIAESSGAYVVFLDGDCIARPDFVAAHRALAEPGFFIGGNRVLLSQALTQDILGQDLEPELWSLGTWAMRRARGDVNRLLPLLNLPLGPLRKRLATEWEGVRGGNFAFWRADLERVDGFETSFIGWGLEDSDIVIRMIRAGVKRKDGRFATGVLHLWHQEADRSELAANRARLEDLLKSDRVRALRGLAELGQDRDPVAMAR
jgi:glycosyltransferase involved in cell wall biosynthesis